MHPPRWFSTDTMLALLLATAVGFLVWKGGEISGRQQKHTDEIADIERRLRVLNDKENEINGNQQAHIDELQRDIGRIDERSTRIVQALDNTYNMLMNHLRDLPASHEELPQDRQSEKKPSDARPK